MIELNSLYKSYGKKVIFEDQSIIFRNCCIYALVGVNGVGKTTLLNSITQAMLFDKGSIKIDGISSNDFKAKYHYSYVPDTKEMFLNLTGKEYVSMIGKLYQRNEKELEKEIVFYANKFKLEKSLDITLSNYSLGMKQKIYLIGAILSNANNIILDEPFNGLDPESVAILKNVLLDFRDKGKTVIFSIHNLDLVSNFCDMVVFIDRYHNIIEYTNPQDFHTLEKVFFEKCVLK